MSALQVSIGPGGFPATNMRHLSAAKAKEEEKEIDWLKPRCTHCGFNLQESDKLLVVDPNDKRMAKIRLNGAALAKAGSIGHADSDSKSQSASAKYETHDYIRIPFTTYNTLQHNAVVHDSDFAFCTNQCGLEYMFRSEATGSKNLVVDRFSDYIRRRYGITEPTIPAPPTECLAYVQTHQNMGLSHSSFYKLLSTLQFQASLAKAGQFVPIAPASVKQKHQTCTHGHDGLPEQIVKKIKDLNAKVATVNLEANPDSDGETDFASEEIFPPSVVASLSVPSGPTRKNKA